MEPEYLKLLCDPLQDLANQIEAKIGSKISVRPRCQEDLMLMPDSSLSFCDCLMEEGVPTVTIAYAGKSLAPHVLAHEVLHAHRNFVLAVEHLAPAVADDSAAQLAARCDNDIEHLFIVPTEISYYPEAVVYWESHYSQRLSELEATTMGEDPALREALLRHWLVTSSVIPEWCGRLDLMSILQSKGWLGDAEKLVEKVNRVKGSKGRCLSALIRFCHIKPARYCLSQFLVSEARFATSKLPSD